VKRPPKTDTRPESIDTNGTLPSAPLPHASLPSTIWNPIKTAQAGFGDVGVERVDGLLDFGLQRTSSTPPPPHDSSFDIGVLLLSSYISTAPVYGIVVPGQTPLSPSPTSFICPLATMPSTPSLSSSPSITSPARSPLRPLVQPSTFPLDSQPSQLQPAHWSSLPRRPLSTKYAANCEQVPGESIPIRCDLLFSAVGIGPQVNPDYNGPGWTSFLTTTRLVA
jgi:hypothetical protein